MIYSVAKAPCKSCPYRRDVPSGVWAAHEYDKLLKFDGDMIEQLCNGAVGRFDCHQQDGNLCAGWLGCHGPRNLLALAINNDKVSPEVLTYESSVPLFGSGKEAAEHGKRDVEQPGRRASSMINRLFRKLTR